jgi:hypothetical protein
MVETVVETPTKFCVLSPFPLKNKDLGKVQANVAPPVNRLDKLNTEGSGTNHHN